MYLFISTDWSKTYKTKDLIFLSLSSVKLFYYKKRIGDSCSKGLFNKSTLREFTNILRVRFINFSYKNFSRKF